MTPATELATWAKWKKNYESRIDIHVGYLMRMMDHDEIELFESNVMQWQLLETAAILIATNSITKLCELVSRLETVVQSTASEKLLH